MKRTVNVILKAAFVAVFSVVTVVALNAKNPKYVFYMIGDGMGINEVYGAQNYNRATGNGPEDINITQFPVRTFVTTFSTALVTYSAAGGTALATGRKTENGVMGMDATKTEAMSSVAEWAKAAGFGTGVATSVGVNHATPAAFYAHTPSRNNYETIAEQLIASKMDFFAGGGFIVEKGTGHDGKYFEDKAKEAGMSVLRGSELKSAGSHKDRVICLSVDTKATNLKYKVDQEPGDTKLAEFTQAGIDYLYANYAKKGFFIMIEGGQIDGAGHNDDAYTNAEEVNDFAEAIDVVLAFYNQHPDETLIVVTADHETGACILGAGLYAMSPELLAYQKGSENTISNKFKAFAQEGRQEPPTWDEAKEFFKENLGLWSKVKVDPRTEADLKEAYERSFIRKENTDVVTLYSVNTKVVSDAIDYLDRQAGYSYAHGSHSGSPVGLYVKGAVADQFMQCRDNTDISKMIAKVAKYQ